VEGGERRKGGEGLGKGKEKGRGGGSEWKGREGSGGANSLPQYFGLEPPLLAAGIDLCSLMTCTTAHKRAVMCSNDVQL